jgi:hypothetical protein
MPSPRRFPAPWSVHRQTVEMLTKQAEALINKLPEYFKLMDGLEQVDPKSSEAEEFMSILSELDKRCTK